MAGVSADAEKVSDLLQNLSIGSQDNNVESSNEPEKKPSSNHLSPTDGKVPNGTGPSCGLSTTPSLPSHVDQNLCYISSGYPSATYYYGGYDGTTNEWEEYPRYVNPDGMEMPQPGVYGDNGSFMYQHGYGYAPYGAYPPAVPSVPTMGHGNQIYGSQQYQYAAPYYFPPHPSDATYNQNQVPPSRLEVPVSVLGEQAPALGAERANENVKGGEMAVNNNRSVPIKPNYPNPLQTLNGSYGRGTLPGVVTSSYEETGFRYDIPVYSDGFQGLIKSNCASTSISSSSSRNQNVYPSPHLMGAHHRSPSSMGSSGFVNSMYSNKVYDHFGSMVRTGPSFAHGGFDSRTNGRGWMVAENKSKFRSQNYGFLGYANENMDGLNELIRGPRGGRFKNQKGIIPNVKIAVKGQNLPLNGKDEDSSGILNTDQYNRSDFPVNYSNGKFFIIKSYSEDDIHRSIKYNVWASTPNGNKKLDAAYREAQEKLELCPVFLFFSVNTSGQFVGLAEMRGAVDFNKKLEYWQQDKWIGSFPVNWHIIKDVPNTLLKHITLVNNDNKPVTNSRDTQEVNLEQGLEMLKIFKDHISKTCMLDDFSFYECRQKTMQARKAKLQPSQKQVPDGKLPDVPDSEKGTDDSYSHSTSQEDLVLSEAINKDASQGSELDGISQENGLVAGVVDDIDEQKCLKLLNEDPVN